MQAGKSEHRQVGLSPAPTGCIVATGWRRNTASRPWSMTKVKVKKYPNYFGCGSSNPIDLRLKHRLEEDHLVTEFVPRKEQQVWPDITHGGIITTLLYEVLENPPYRLGVVTMIKARTPETGQDREEPGCRVVARGQLGSKYDRVGFPASRGCRADCRAEHSPRGAEPAAKGTVARVIESPPD